MGECGLHHTMGECGLHQNPTFNINNPSKGTLRSGSTGQKWLVLMTIGDLQIIHLWWKATITQR